MVLLSLSIYVMFYICTFLHFITLVLFFAFLCFFSPLITTYVQNTTLSLICSSLVLLTEPSCSYDILPQENKSEPPIPSEIFLEENKSQSD